MARDEDEDDAEQAHRREHPAAARADPRVAREPVGVDDRGEPVEEVDDDRAVDRGAHRGVEERGQQVRLVRRAQDEPGAGGDREGRQDRPGQGAQPAAEVGMSEPGVEEGEERRRERTARGRTGRPMGSSAAS